MRPSFPRFAIFAALLTAAPALGEAQAPPPEVESLAEATCKAEEFCEATEVQMFPDGGAAFLWLVGGCGVQNCPTLILVQDGGNWRVTDPALSTPPGSAAWLEKGDLVFEGPTGFTTSGKPRCLLFWHWTGTELQQTDAYLTSETCAVD
ncbi:hypothetical protein [Stagnihabitans tardus]|uniref:Uncharacterized protein n=1 Tax=Stagnihabitans tardus TaxID=2699202 RepID=A0AAE4Y7K4_9RHOB|nr:hypothetical protein [Stagnihabitans tardus]NBZ86003.1 hypothetical protein [Stagnihabitans tardus]